MAVPTFRAVAVEAQDLEMQVRPSLSFQPTVEISPYVPSAATVTISIDVIKRHKGEFSFAATGTFDFPPAIMCESFYLGGQITTPVVFPDFLSVGRPPVCVIFTMVDSPSSRLRSALFSVCTVILSKICLGYCFVCMWHGITSLPSGYKLVGATK